MKLDITSVQCLYSLCLDLTTIQTRPRWSVPISIWINFYIFDSCGWFWIFWNHFFFTFSSSLFNFFLSLHISIWIIFYIFDSCGRNLEIGNNVFSSSFICKIIEWIAYTKNINVLYNMTWVQIISLHSSNQTWLDLEECQLVWGQIKKNITSLNCIFFLQ